MRDSSITHRQNGRGYLLVIEGVQETILMGADDLLSIVGWCEAHKGELERESKDEYEENARRLLED